MNSDYVADLLLQGKISLCEAQDMLLSELLSPTRTEVPVRTDTKDDTT